MKFIRHWISRGMLLFSHRRFWWRRKWNVIDRKLWHSFRSMDDTHIHSWCHIKNMAAITRHCQSSDICFSLSYIQFIHGYARRIFLSFGYISMDKSTDLTWTSSIFTYDSITNSQENLANVFITFDIDLKLLLVCFLCGVFFSMLNNIFWKISFESCFLLFFLD